MARSSVRVSLVAALSVMTLAACSPPSSSGGSGGGSAAKATSASDLGGMAGLVKAAKKEGKLNVIALPPDWANYANIIKGFEDKYGIKVTSQQPDAGSQDEIDAAKRTKGTSRAPDVFDLGQAVALANTSMYAKYKVSTWNDITAKFKDPKGAWVNDYGGYMAIGYDSAKVPQPKSIDDLLKPAYKGKVALNGDPTTAGSGFSGVLMAAVHKGGSADNISPGVDFFRKVKKAGNLVPVDPTSATIESGQTPVVIDWDYTNGAHVSDVPSWKVVLLPKVAVGGFYYQAINAGRAAPGRCPAVGGVPLLRRGPEPLARGRCPADPRRRDGQGRHDRQGEVRRAPEGAGLDRDPVDGSDDQARRVPRKELGCRGQVTAPGAAAVTA